MVRLGLVGYGRWGRNYVRAAQDAGNAEVVRLVLRPGSAAWSDASARRLAPVASIEDLDGVDAIIVATPPSEAPALVERILRAGIPVMVEKPGALCVDDARRVATAARKARVPFLVAHQHLFADHMELAREQGAIGPLFASWGGPGPERGYSALWDYGPHAVSSILAIRRRPPDSVQVIGSGGSYTVKMWFGETIDRAIVSNEWPSKHARLSVQTRHGLRLLYDGFAPAEPCLTRAVRAFARAVEEWNLNDWRFGGRWAQDVAEQIDVGYHRLLATL